MANPYFQFKQFIIYQDHCAMKVTTDACLFGAWCANEIQSLVRKLDEKIEPAVIQNNRTLMDAGTGTGLLSLMIAQKNKVRIDAVELEVEAAKQAKENCARSVFSEQIQVIQGDILSLNSQYDFIVSNPPFYENELNSPEQKKNIAHHSRQLTVKQLTRSIYDLLSTNGNFFLLLPYKRVAEIEQQLASVKLFISKMVMVKPTLKHQPTRVMVAGNKYPGELVRSEITIKEVHHQYSHDFQKLLKDYYLSL